VKLKLDVSEKLMKNYIEKQIPKKTELDNLIKDYESLLEQLKEYRDNKL